MKNNFFISVLMTALVLGFGLSAEEPLKITLSNPPDLTAQTCATPIWRNLEVKWLGVTDGRELKEVGIQTQKNKEPVLIYSDKPLEKVYDDALTDMFSKCGMKFVKNDDAVQLSVEIREFNAGSSKKFLTGKSDAKSKLAFLTEHNGQTTQVVIGCDLESKNIRQAKLKQLEKTLNTLFVETLKEVFRSTELKDLK